MNINRMSLVSRKKEAVTEMINTSKNKKFSKKEFRVMSKKYGITRTSLELAMQNFLNFGYVDRRFRSPDAKRATTKGIDKYLNFNSNTDTINKFKYKDVKEIRVKLHEYINSPDRIGDFLIKNQISGNQWYGVLRDLYITGKIGNKMIFNFREYGKINMKLVVRYAKYRYGRQYTVDSQIFRALSTKHNLTDDDKLRIKRAAHILQMYLV